MWYWMSFANSKESLGCCIVQAENPLKAISTSFDLGINPGGQAYIVEMCGVVPHDFMRNWLMPPEAVKRVVDEIQKDISRVAVVVDMDAYLKGANQTPAVVGECCNNETAAKTGKCSHGNDMVQKYAKRRF